ncbi:MAG: TerB family tellurite resistance protein [Candidatus Melainabacteria bacterium]|nr:TerB family tellurite resistance protein [Candidatus Melainabacteria bacterium]
MGFFDNLKNAGTELATRAKQFQNTNFKEATIAIVALIAAADGSISTEEKASVAQAIVSIEALKVFKARDLGDLFNRYCDDAVNQFARLDLIKKVQKLQGNSDSAITAIKIGIIVANSDGNFSKEEKDVVRELLRATGQTEAALGVKL